MDDKYANMALGSNYASKMATIDTATRAYLSVLLSRRSERTGRTVVHRSSVIASLFSIITLAISADTWS
jgi:hypothetical protein